MHKKEAGAKPYIGVTGAVSIDEITAIGEAFYQTKYTHQTPHIPMIGILVCDATRNNNLIKNRRYPLYKEVPALIKKANKYGFPTIYYHTQNQENLAEQVSECLDICEGLQLNLDWPDVIEVQKIKKIRPDLAYSPLCDFSGPFYVQVIYKLSKTSGIYKFCRDDLYR